MTLLFRPQTHLECKNFTSSMVSRTTIVHGNQNAHEICNLYRFQSMYSIIYDKTPPPVGGRGTPPPATTHLHPPPPPPPTQPLKSCLDEYYGPFCCYQIQYFGIRWLEFDLNTHCTIKIAMLARCSNLLDIAAYGS